MSNSTLLRRLLSLYRPYWGWLLLGGLLSLMTLLANVGLLALSGWFITAMAAAGVAGTSINYFTPAALIRGMAMLRTGGRYGERIVTHEATFRLIEKLRVWFFARIEPLAPAGLAGLHSGDLLSRLQKDIDRLDGLYLRLLLPSAVALIAWVGFTSFLLAYDSRLALVLAVLLLLGGLIIPLVVLRMSSAAGAAQVGLSAALRVGLLETLQGMGELLNSSAEQRQQQQLTGLSDALIEQQSQLQRWASLSQASLGLLAGIALWLFLLIGLSLLEAGLINGPQLAMLALFALAAFEAIAPMPLAFQLWPETKAAALRLFGLADQHPVVREPDTANALPTTTDLHFDRISFAYDAANDAANPVLSDFSAQFPSGSKTLILGESGSGKSSLINLLMRFWEPDQGEIRFGGSPLNRLDSTELRRQFSIAPQNPHLFSSSLRDNLKLAAPNASDQQLIAALQTAQLSDFLDSLPDGLDTWLGDTGTKVSGGQARRIAIARALLKDAPVLILDEPTEGLDRGTAAELMKSLSPACGTTTLIVVSHRNLSGIEFDQRIHLSPGTPDQGLN